MSDDGENPSDEGIRNIPDDPVPETPADSNAKKEQEAILKDEYGEDARRQDHRRDQGIKNLSYYATATLVWGGVVLIVITTAVWAWHILAPQCLTWLSPDQVNHIQSLLFSSALSAALTLLGRKIL